jgi:hypothetical protein
MRIRSSWRGSPMNHPEGEPRVLQASLNSELWKARVVFDPVQAFFGHRSHRLSIDDERSGRTGMEGIDPKDHTHQNNSLYGVSLR